MFKKTWLVPVGVVAVAAVAFVAFGVFGIHTLFIDDMVDEDNPFAVDDAGADVVDDPPTETTGGSAAPEPDEAEAPTIDTLAEGQFIDRDHPASGTATVITDGSQTFLRFEDFETDNGPDLFVYLSTAPADAPEGDFDDDFVDLGRLKGNIGDQNYEIPAHVDLGEHTTVVIWCKRFSVAFGAAGLS